VNTAVAGLHAVADRYSCEYRLIHSNIARVDRASRPLVPL
jgi:hypothetical protein